MSTDPARRRALRTLALAATAVPLLRVPAACAATNPALRAQLKYQDIPSGDMNCANCVDFIPGANDTALGGCTRISGDNEIRPEGYCNAWNTM